MGAVAMVGREREQGDAGLSCSRLNRIVTWNKQHCRICICWHNARMWNIVVPKHTPHSECAIGAQDESGFGSSGGWLKQKWTRGGLSWQYSMAWKEGGPSKIGLRPHIHYSALCFKSVDKRENKSIYMCAVFNTESASGRCFAIDAIHRMPTEKDQATCNYGTRKANNINNFW